MVIYVDASYPPRVQEGNDRQLIQRVSEPTVESEGSCEAVTRSKGDKGAGEDAETLMREDNLIDPDSTPQSVVVTCLCIALLRIASEIELHCIASRCRPRSRGITVVLRYSGPSQSGHRSLDATCPRAERSTSRRPLHIHHPFNPTAHLPTPCRPLPQGQARSSARNGSQPQPFDKADGLCTGVIVPPSSFPLHSCEFAFRS